MEPVTISVILAQIGVSFFNQGKNKKMVESIKNEQRMAKENEIRNSHKRDMEKFLRSCELQERMELEAHQFKVKSIRQGFMNSFTKMVHKDNLDKHYRLNVSPYIIQRSVIPLTEAEIDNVRQELFCILTSSNDAEFNAKLLPNIDESIGGVLSKFWNETSNHTICYYQNMWNTNADTFSEEDIENLRVLIPTPTVAVTPLLYRCESGIKLTLLISMWGAGNGDALRQFEIDPEINFERLSNNFTKTDREKAIECVTAYAVCSIGQIADVFYWTNFYQSPLLPCLLANDFVKISETAKKEYAEVYSQMYNQLVLGIFPEDPGCSDSLQLAKDLVEINQYNHPERTLSFLKSIIRLTGSYVVSSVLIEKTVNSLCKIKTDHESKCLDEINSSLLKKEDISFIAQLLELANGINDSNLAKEISGIIKRNIKSWIK